MSELIAEARVLVRPDTTRFREALRAQLLVAARGVTVPIAIRPTITGEAATVASAVAAAETQVAASTRAASRAEAQGAIDARARAAALREEERAAARASARNAQAARGAASAALSFAGLRGATLAAGGGFLAGAAGAVILGKSISAFKDFQTELNTFRVTADATNKQMQEVSATAVQLGADITLPGVSAQDAAEALTELSKAGLSTQDSIDGVRGVLQLATAAGIDNAQATELVANALNVFKLNGTQAAHVADLLAAASKESQGSIVDVGLALKQSAAAASIAGVSVEDTIALLTQLARAGLTASDAGTSLRVLLIRLINPTKQARAELKKLGVTVQDAQGRIRPEAFSEILDALDKLPEKQRLATLAIIAGQDAFRSLAILGRDGVGALNEVRNATQQEGAAAEIASAKTQGLAGSFENAKNNASNLGITLGQLASGPVAFLLDRFSDLAGLLNAGLKLGTGNIDETTQNFTELTKEAAKLQQTLLTGNAKDFTGQLTVGLEAVSKQLGKTGAELVRQGFLTKVIESFIRISPQVKTAMQDNVITPLEVTELKATSLGRAFLEAVPHTPDLFQDFSLSAQDAIEGARSTLDKGGKTLAQVLAESIHDGVRLVEPTVVQTGEEIAANLVKGITGAIDTAQGAIQDAFHSVLRGERLDIGRLASQVLDVQFQGGSDAQLRAVLARELKRQQDLVATLTAKQAPRKAIDAAKQQAIDTQRQIDQIDQAAAAEREKNANKRAQDAKAAQTKREQDQRALEQRFLNQQERSRQQAQNRVTRAEQTPGVQDDLRRQQELLALEKQQITAIRNSKLSEDAKRTAIDALNTAVIATTGAIKALHQTQAQEQAAEKQRLFDLKAQTLENQALRAQLTDSDKDDESVLKAQIKLFVNRARRLGLATKAGKDAVGQALQFAGQLRDLLKARQQIDQAAQGLSIAGFLTENTNLFKNIASNIGTVGKDPFSGFDFSKSITSTLIRLQSAAPGSVPSRITPSVGATPSSTAQIDATINKLIAALDRNTAATTGNTGANIGSGAGLNATAKAEVRGRFPLGNRFWENRLDQQQTQDSVG